MGTQSTFRRLSPNHASWEDIPSWQEFERTVATLLTIAGYDVIPEIMIGSKKVDMFAIKPEFGSKRHYAIECKDYEQKIDKTAIAIIQADYADLYESRKIDVLLLVTRSGISAAAQRKVKDSRFLLHQTIYDLRFALMDFRQYMVDIQSQYRKDGLHRYYVHARNKPSASCESPQDIEATVNAWLNAPDAPPLALLGGYGAGKSTFLRHLANSFVDRFKSGLLERIPILIPLSEICSEQTIEGLLGRHFTSLHPVAGYSFNMFQELNRLGSFILLLDGFDEMKHSMTASVFRYTFKEVLKLCIDNSKVIITGRPTAFLTEDERRELLQALSIQRNREINIPNKPRFREIELAPFDREQIERFIDRYSTYLLLTRRDKTRSRIPEKEEFFKSPTLLDLAKRPIQLRMLFDVLPVYEGNVDELTVRELYGLFVDLIIEREFEEHPARRLIPASHRKRFLEALAFHMWQRGVVRLGIEDIPRASVAVASDLSELEDFDEEGLRRDLISGSLVEAQYPAQIYFPHRSIQEFLVSEFLLEYLREESWSERFSQAVKVNLHFGFIEERISPEIMDFMIASSGPAERKAGLRSLHVSGRALSLKSLRFWIDRDESMQELEGHASSGDVWALALLVIGRLEKGWSSKSPSAEALYSSALSCLNTCGDNKRSVYQAFFLNWVLISSEQNEVTQEHWLQVACARLVAFMKAKERYATHDLGKGRASPPYTVSLVEKLLQSGGPPDVIDLGRIASDIVAECRGLIGLTSWYRHDHYSWEERSLGGVNVKLVRKVRPNEKISRLLQAQVDEGLKIRHRKRGR